MFYSKQDLQSAGPLFIATSALAGYGPFGPAASGADTVEPDTKRRDRRLRNNFDEIF
jgi:hypothetical protein